MEVLDDFINAAVAQQRHADDQPDHHLRGQLAFPYTGCAGGGQHPPDPLDVQCAAEQRETLTPISFAEPPQGLRQIHPPLLLCPVVAAADLD